MCVCVCAHTLNFVRHLFVIRQRFIRSSSTFHLPKAMGDGFSLMEGVHGVAVGCFMYLQVSRVLMQVSTLTLALAERAERFLVLILLLLPPQLHM